MRTMSQISGKDNEFEFVKSLNGKMICELNPMFRELIDKLFPFVSDKSVIKSWRNHYEQKSDIFIKINGIMKGVSIKKGIRNSVHVEAISYFVRFLKENGISQEIIDEYLKYHFADGTTKGCGINRISAEEYKKDHQHQIDMINEVFCDEGVLKNAINRFITKGNNSNYHIDAIIYGEVNDFIWATRSDIEKIILSKKGVYSTAVHFGPITCQPKNRCLNFNKKYEKERYCVQLKWYNLHDDIIELMNNKVSHNIIC